ncbi:gibberellin-regulated protein 12-like isoform X2 [Tasmannia lanceolata]|uniref:gibberellin-regulated protein 12-like isoform X2 n=1 Tax=Tasmannia lanceolata TaxID=3420 RepID=UPI004062B6A9
MASFSFLSASFLLFLALVLLVELSNEGGPGSVQAKDCPNKCAYRCSATSHKKPCMFYCIKCCTECLCVPSGTYGHREECPCYNQWKTKEGKPKCP